jgi:DNA modification methylase
LSVNIWQGHAPDIMDRYETASVDAVITDPPYPEISRPYGRLTEAEWWDLMRAVVKQTRRVLKPTGSAVFILQANQEYVGRTRPWLWEFMAWIARDWNMVQDVWWWNPAAMPTVHTGYDNGLMRPSVKACVWAGAPTCYRNQSEVRWTAAEASMADKREDRALRTGPSGSHARFSTSNARARGGEPVVPFNLIPISNTNSASSGGALGHGAATPDDLCEWWVRYLTHPGQLVMDPFCGSGSIPQAADRLGRDAIGIEKDAASVEMARARLVKDAGMFAQVTVS